MVQAGRLGNAGRNAGYVAGKGVNAVGAGARGVGKAAKAVYIDAPLKVISKISPNAAAGIRAGGKAVGGKVIALTTSKFATRAVPIVGWVAQAGFSIHSIGETRHQMHELDKAIERGDWAKAKELQKKLKNWGWDIVFGKGGTKGLGDLMKSAGRGLENHLHRCAGEITSFELHRNALTCAGRTVLAPVKAVAKASIWLHNNTIGATARAAHRCYKQGASACGDSIKKGLNNAWEGTKKLGNNIGNWFTKMNESRKSRIKTKNERYARYDRHCKKQALSWWSCRKYKGDQERKREERMEAAKKKVKRELELEEERKKSSPEAVKQRKIRQYELKLIRMGLSDKEARNKKIKEYSLTI